MIILKLEYLITTISGLPSPGNVLSSPIVNFKLTLYFDLCNHCSEKPQSIIQQVLSITSYIGEIIFKKIKTPYYFASCVNPNFIGKKNIVLLFHYYKNITKVSQNVLKLIQLKFGHKVTASSHIKIGVPVSLFFKILFPPKNEVLDNNYCTRLKKKTETKTNTK